MMASKPIPPLVVAKHTHTFCMMELITWEGQSGTAQTSTLQLEKESCGCMDSEYLIYRGELSCTLSCRSSLIPAHHKRHSGFLILLPRAGAECVNPVNRAWPSSVMFSHKMRMRIMSGLGSLTRKTL